MNILWADDDSEQALKSLGWFIDKLLMERSRIGPIRRATNYKQAKEELEKANSDSPYLALLLDVVLPHVGNDSSLSRFHGLRLAETAIKLGVKSVVFLTVVPLDQINNTYTQLKKDNTNVHFAYHSKLDLATPNKIDAVVRDLTTIRSNDAGPDGD